MAERGNRERGTHGYRSRGTMTKQRRRRKRRRRRRRMTKQ